MVSGSSTRSSWPRQTSQASHVAAWSCWPKYSTMARCRHCTPLQKFSIAGQRLERAVAGRRLGLFDDALPHAVVPAGEEQAALGFQAVAPGPAAFLLVVLQRLGHARVDHVADVGLVDAHAKGDRGHDRVGLVFDKRVLVAVPLVVGQAGVVGQRAIAQFRQGGGGLIHVLASDAVDDARLAPMPLQHFADLPQPVVPPLHFVDQVGPIERADQDFRIAQLQLFRDIPPHGFRRGGRVGVDADVRKCSLSAPAARGTPGGNRVPRS